MTLQTALEEAQAQANDNRNSQIVLFNKKEREFEHYQQGYFKASKNLVVVAVVQPEGWKYKVVIRDKKSWKVIEVIEVSERTALTFSILSRNLTVKDGGVVVDLICASKMMDTFETDQETAALLFN